MNQRHQDPARVCQDKAPKPAGPLIRATTIPTAKLDPEATHWSASVVMARALAPLRKSRRGPESDGRQSHYSSRLAA